MAATKFVFAFAALVIWAANGLASAASTALPPASQSAALPGIPEIKRSGGGAQLFVDGKPFLILGGEVFNSSSSSRAFMGKIWPHMNRLHANTVLTPVTWEMVEPKEGVFDFKLLDGLITDARAHNLHLVLLWLASWKNGMSSYAPVWVKQDFRRFPRVRNRNGEPREVLSTLSQNNWNADARAFAQMMRHLRTVDGRHHTVLMIQVENEVGILGDSRDRSDLANRAFSEQVPQELMQHLQQPGVILAPDLLQRWIAGGGKASGAWEEVFGAGKTTDEIFMAWNYARYVDRVAAAGKSEYPLPMYANAWLDGNGANPGDYPSGCPESHLLDVWQAGAPHLNMLSPDLYASNFQDRCEAYSQHNNPLFIPEMNSDETASRNIFYAIGHFQSIGTSPFGIDRTPDDGPFSKAYGMLEQIAPLLLKQQAQGKAEGFVLDQDHPKETIPLDGYDLDISLDSMFGRTVATSAYGIIIATGNGAFTGAGAGFQVSFRPRTAGPKFVGLGVVEEGEFHNGVWLPGRRLNGDETSQGLWWRFPAYLSGIKRCTTYRYE